MGGLEGSGEEQHVGGTEGWLGLLFFFKISLCIGKLVLQRERGRGIFYPLVYSAKVHSG